MCTKYSNLILIHYFSLASIQNCTLENCQIHSIDKSSFNICQHPNISCDNNSICISPDMLCNDKNDCSDGSDEGGQCGKYYLVLITNYKWI